MVKSCCVIGCVSRFEKGSGVSFYRFPKDDNLRQCWIIAVKRQDWSPGLHTFICSKHFVSGERNFDPNHPDFIPSVFDNPGKDKRCNHGNSAKLRRKEMEMSAQCDAEASGVSALQEWDEEFRGVKTHSNTVVIKPVQLFPKKTCVVKDCDKMPSISVGVQYFNFPKDPTQLDLWKHRLGLHENWFPSKSRHFVCSKHFISGYKSDCQQHPDYAPQVFAYTHSAHLQRMRIQLSKIENGGPGHKLQRDFEHLEKQWYRSGYSRDALVEGFQRVQTAKRRKVYEDNQEMRKRRKQRREAQVKALALSLGRKHTHNLRVKRAQKLKKERAQKLKMKEAKERRKIKAQKLRVARSEEFVIENDIAESPEDDEEDMTDRKDVDMDVDLSIVKQEPVSDTECDVKQEPVSDTECDVKLEDDVTPGDDVKPGDDVMPGDDVKPGDYVKLKAGVTQVGEAAALAEKKTSGPGILSVTDIKEEAEDVGYDEALASKPKTNTGDFCDEMLTIHFGKKYNKPTDSMYDTVYEGHVASQGTFPPPGFVTASGLLAPQSIVNQTMPSAMLPQTMQPVMLPQTMQPAMLPQTMQPVMLPQTMQPAMLPQTMQPVMLPQIMHPSIYTVPKSYYQQLSQKGLQSLLSVNQFSTNQTVGDVVTKTVFALDPKTYKAPATLNSLYVVPKENCISLSFQTTPASGVNPSNVQANVPQFAGNVFPKMAGSSSISQDYDQELEMLYGSSRLSFRSSSPSMSEGLPEDDAEGGDMSEYIPSSEDSDDSNYFDSDLDSEKIFGNKSGPGNAPVKLANAPVKCAYVPVKRKKVTVKCDKNCQTPRKMSKVSTMLKQVNGLGLVLNEDQMKELLQKPLYANGLCPSIQLLRKMVVNVGIQSNMDNVLIKALKSQCKKLTNDITEGKRYLDVLKYNFLKAGVSERTIRMYTGCFTLESLKVLFEYCSIDKHSEVSASASNLSEFQEFVMTLMKLRLGLRNMDLAFRFDVEFHIVPQLLTKWIHIFANTLSHLVQWPTVEPDRTEHRNQRWRLLKLRYDLLMAYDRIDSMKDQWLLEQDVDDVIKICDVLDKFVIDNPKVESDASNPPTTILLEPVKYFTEEIVPYESESNAEKISDVETFPKVSADESGGSDVQNPGVHQLGQNVEDGKKSSEDDGKESMKGNILDEAKGDPGNCQEISMEGKESMEVDPEQLEIQEGVNMAPDNEESNEKETPKVQSEVDKMMGDNIIHDDQQPVRDNSVGMQPVRDNSVGTQAVRDNSVGTQAVHDNSVGTQAVRDNSVGTQAVRDNSVGAQAVRDNSVGTQAVRSNSVGMPVPQSFPELKTVLNWKNEEKTILTYLYGDGVVIGPPEVEVVVDGTTEYLEKCELEIDDMFCDVPVIHDEV